MVRQPGWRRSRTRQTRDHEQPALYVFPLGILVTGAFFPGLRSSPDEQHLTHGQQHIVFGQIEKEEAAKQAKQEKRKANAPQPGARPNRTKRGVAAPAKVADESADSDGAGTESSSVDMTKPGQKPTKPQAGAKPAAKPALGPNAAGANRKSRLGGKVVGRQVLGVGRRAVPAAVKVWQG